MKNERKTQRISQKTGVKKSAFGLVFGFLFLLCAGCAGNSKKEIKTLESGVLKVGMELGTDKLSYLPEGSNIPEGFEVEVAGELAKKLGLKLEIVDTSEKNLLKSLDGKIYDCVISGVGIAAWNDEHYSHTKPYADISRVREQLGYETEFSDIAVFTKKNNPIVKKIDEELESLKKNGTLEQISKKYFEKNIIIEE